MLTLMIEGVDETALRNRRNRFVGGGYQKTMAEPASTVFENVLRDAVAGVVDAAPRALLGLFFLVVAYVVINTALRVLRGGLRKAYPDDQRLVADLLTTVAGVFAWFGTALVFFDIVGIGRIAASLGTSTGFVALASRTRFRA